MDCVDYERIWNEQLDARELGPLDCDPALEAHAATCQTCRQVTLHFQTLQRVLQVQAVAGPPTPSSSFVQRFLEQQASQADLIAYRPRQQTSLMRWLTIAASLILMSLIGWYSLSVNSEPAPRPGELVADSIMIEEAPLLTDALAAASAATWDLAVETSAPAARIGREILEVSTFRGAPPEIEFENTDEADSDVPLEDKPEDKLALTSTDPRTNVLQTVGERFNAGVRPLSGTARHAFGFLLGTPENAVTTHEKSTNGS